MAEKIVTWYRFMESPQVGVSMDSSPVHMACFILYVLSQYACIWRVVAAYRLLQAFDWKEARLVGLGAVRITGFIDARQPEKLGDLLGPDSP